MANITPTTTSIISDAHIPLTWNNDFQTNQFEFIEKISSALIATYLDQYVSDLKLLNEDLTAENFKKDLKVSFDITDITHTMNITQIVSEIEKTQNNPTFSFFKEWKVRYQNEIEHKNEYEEFFKEKMNLVVQALANKINYSKTPLLFTAEWNKEKQSLCLIGKDQPDTDSEIWNKDQQPFLVFDKKYFKTKSRGPNCYPLCRFTNNLSQLTIILTVSLLFILSIQGVTSLFWDKGFLQKI